MSAPAREHVHVERGLELDARLPSAEAGHMVGELRQLGYEVEATHHDDGTTTLRYPPKGEAHE